MEEEQKKRIEEIMGGMECPRDFRCGEPESLALCKAEDRGLRGYLDCLEPEPSDCTFAVPFGNGYFCRCPLRVYLGKELGI